ncbi:MAG: DUF1273 family protein [Oscillospiraceae bacterium]|nr:DUF1273 family protein [Oscillospiraceae bacterium]
MICTIISDDWEYNVKYRNEHDEPYLKIKQQLRGVIWQLYCDGYDEFYVNCEYGIPLWSAEIIAALKFYNKICLKIVTPFEEQCCFWTENERDRYYAIHKMADTVEFACKGYRDNCYSIADEMMIDKSDLVIIFTKIENKLCAEQYAKEKGISFKIIKY